MPFSDIALSLCTIYRIEYDESFKVPDFFLYDVEKGVWNSTPFFCNALLCHVIKIFHWLTLKSMK